MFRELCHPLHKVNKLPAYTPYNIDTRGEGSDHHKPAFELAEHIKEYTELCHGRDRVKADSVKQKPLHSVLFRQLHSLVGVFVEIAHEKIGHTARSYFF